MNFNWKAALNIMMWMLIGLAIVGSLVALTVVIMLNIGAGWGIGFLLGSVVLGMGVLVGITEGKW